MTDLKNSLNSIAPWLTVSDGPKAAEFYKAAFNAVEVYRLDDPDAGFVVRLSVGEADFWISGDASDALFPLGGGSVRMILTVDDPDTVFRQAITAGAKEVFPVGETHGWRLGRLEDPFGLHWEIGYQLI